MRHKITLGFSPCPNDTFIFDALVNGRIENELFEIDVVLADVEQLNQMALAGKLDVTKISYNAYARVHGSYQLLNSGSALGNNCGPLLIARQPMGKEEVVEKKIAIPGANTTANFLMSFAYPDVLNKVEYLFSEIENAILSGEVGAGVIIHENRFTYQAKGLVKIRDLGEFWEEETGFPIPLGGIAAHRRLKPIIRQKFDKMIRESVEFAFENPEASRAYVKCHSQELDDEVIKSHINLYVNQYSVHLGEKGKAAVEKMYEVGSKFSNFPRVEHSLFASY